MRRGAMLLIGLGLLSGCGGDPPGKGHEIPVDPSAPASTKNQGVDDPGPIKIEMH